MKSRKSIAQIRSSIKQMAPKPIQAPAPAETSGAMDGLKAVFNGNTKKISDLEYSLAKKRS